MVDGLHDGTARALLEYDRWANRLVLDRCADLSHEDFHRGFDIGVGSLHRQMAHVVIVILVWTGVLEGRAMREDPEDMPWSVGRMREELVAAHDAFDASLASRPLTDLVTRSYKDGDVTTPRSTIMAHVTTHNAHHRAQCLHMLKRLGMETPLPCSLIAWHSARHHESH